MSSVFCPGNVRCCQVRFADFDAVPSSDPTFIRLHGRHDDYHPAWLTGRTSGRTSVELRDLHVIHSTSLPESIGSHWVLVSSCALRSWHHVLSHRVTFAEIPLTIDFAEFAFRKFTLCWRHIEQALHVQWI